MPLLTGLVISGDLSAIDMALLTELDRPVPVMSALSFLMQPSERRMFLQSRYRWRPGKDQRPLMRITSR